MKTTFVSPNPPVLICAATEQSLSCRQIPTEFCQTGPTGRNAIRYGGSTRKPAQTQIRQLNQLLIFYAR
jgi:hypothetical protein